jgi:small subunit ribosomal protein S17
MADEEKNETTEEQEPQAEEAPPEEAAAEEAPAEEAPAEEAPAEEAAAEEPAADEAPAEDGAPAEEAELAPTHPREVRKRERREAPAEARPQRSSEERAAERAQRRAAKAAQRRAWRGSAREKARRRRADSPAAPPSEPVPRAHGKPKVRQGVVVSDKADKTITVRIDLARRHPLYEKIVRSSTTLHAHDERNEAHAGDTVRVIESRPLSRTKRWRLAEILERAR